MTNIAHRFLFHPLATRITRNRIKITRLHNFIALFEEYLLRNFGGSTLYAKFRLIARVKLHPLPALMSASTCTSSTRNLHYLHAPPFTLDYYYEFTALFNFFVEIRGRP